MRTIKRFLVCLCLSSLFAFMAGIGSVHLRTACIGLGARWSFLASMGGIMVFISLAVLIGATAGAMVGKKLCCRGHKLSILRKKAERYARLLFFPKCRQTRN